MYWRRDYRSKLKSIIIEKKFQLVISYIIFLMITIYYSLNDGVVVDAI